MKTKITLKEVAKLYAIQAISYEDVESITGYSKEDMPAVFFKYAELFKDAYCKHLEEQMLLATALSIVSTFGSDFDIDTYRIIIKR